MKTGELIRLLNSELPVNFGDEESYEEIKSHLAAYLDNLIQNDFDKLIMYLYRIDVSEQKLKRLLHENQEEDASDIIAALIIERQLQKITFRKNFTQPENKNDQEEKW